MHASCSITQYSDHSLQVAFGQQFSIHQLKLKKKLRVRLPYGLKLPRLNELPFGSNASTSERKFLPLSPPKIYQTPSITKDPPSLRFEVNR